MKKHLRLLAWFLTLTMLCELLPLGTFAQSDIGQSLAQAAAQNLNEQNSIDFAGGTGTLDDPYQISTPEQLDAIRNNLNANYVLVNDIDLSSWGNWMPIGNSDTPFTGSIDGVGHSIKNMTIDVSNLVYCGFIGRASGATIRNLSFDHADVRFATSDEYQIDVSIIVGAAFKCIIENCTTSGSIQALNIWASASIGGIAGSISDASSISGCVNYASITVPDTSPTGLNCGGIAGYSTVALSNCENYGNINVSSLTHIRVGGIVGCGYLNYDSSFVTLCKNFGTISASCNTQASIHSNVVAVGGIAGIGTVSNSVNCGSVSLHCPNNRNRSAAGIVGNDEFTEYASRSSSASSCYNLATNISSTYGDGTKYSAAYRIGANNESIIRDCYSLGTTLVNGSIPTEELGSDAPNGESLSYDEIIARVKEIFPDFEDPARPEEPDVKAPFEFGKDNLSFLNIGDYFFDDWELYYSQNHNDLSKKVHSYLDKKYADGKGNQYFYQISDEKFNQLTANLEPRIVNYLNYQRFCPWDGSCEGMSRVVMLHYLNPELVSLDKVSFGQTSTVYGLDKPRDSISIENLINYYYLMQFLPTSKHYNADVYTRYQDDVLGEVESILHELRNGKPVFTSIVSDKGGHAIVLLDILSEEDDYCDIRVYDPNYSDAQTLRLFKASYYLDSDNNSWPEIAYYSGAAFYSIHSHILADDIDLIDLRNYFGSSDNETETDFDDAHVTFNDTSTNVWLHYGRVFVQNENGKLVYADDVRYAPFSNITKDDLPYRAEFIFPKQPGEIFEMTLTPEGDNSATSDILLNDTLFSISSSGAVKLTYDEQNRKVDVTSTTGEPIQVNMSFTQNDVDESWPWHSWAIDTTGTTEFHAELKDDGLHLSGDGIANAQYATENADTDVVANGTIPANANDVTIVKKDGDDQQTAIKDNTSTDPSEPTDPDKLTVTVEGGTVTQINDDVVDPAKASVEATENDVITITADDKSDEGKTFREWVVTPAGSVELEDASSSTTSFTMGAASVTIKAQYDSAPGPIPTPDPTPTPGGGDSGSGGSSSGGSSGGGGAAVILGLGAAAAITAGVILTMPVDVQGHVELADHAVVSGAKISLLQNGNVVMQTTADESGNFSLKAKRGDYELTVVYTDANGQFVQKTTSIKAPAKDLVITF